MSVFLKGSEKEIENFQLVMMMIAPFYLAQKKEEL